MRFMPFSSGGTIKDRLIRMQLTVAAVVLFASVTSLMIHDLYSFKQALVRTIVSTSRILTTNIAPAVTFMDAKAAEKILQSLRSNPDIIAAQVYDVTEKFFVGYGPSFPVNELPQMHGESASYVDGDYLFSFHLMAIEGEPAGMLVLKSDVRVLREQYRILIVIVLFIMLAGMLLAYWLAHKMQAGLSRPISGLVEVTRRISQSGDYSLRVSTNRQENVPDEISSLSYEFDQMLDQIAARENTIKETNQFLENKVEERTEQLKRTQSQALENAHAAGMAEIATSTLHNIGNLINSVGVSIELIQTTLRQSCYSNLNRAMAMLDANRANLAEFLTKDKKGTILPEYLKEAFAILGQEHEQIGLESSHLAKKIKMIKDVVATQQDYAKGNFLVEEVSLAEVVDDILSMQDSGFLRHSILLEKKIAQVPLVTIHRTKLAHVILNLIKNAKEAMQECREDGRHLGIEVGQTSGSGVFLKISDSGEGVVPENLHKIFNHGFTTKRAGHGFGLHFCANAMTEMGGSLKVESEGLGKGSTFILNFAPNAKQATESPDDRLAA